MDYQEMINKFRKQHKYEDVFVANAMFHYLWCGSGNKTIILLTGGMGISEMWFPYIEALEKNYEIITFDYPMECKTNQQLVHGINAFLDQLAVYKAVFIGSSFGGYLAQIFARGFPNKVEALCLFSTAGLTENTLAGLKQRFKAMSLLLFAMKTVPYSWLKPIFRKMALKHMTNVTVEEYHFFSNAIYEVFKNYTRNMDLHMTELLMDILNQPICKPNEFDYLKDKVLLILPNGDNSFTPQMQKELINLMNSPTVIENMDTGHLATFLRVDQYVEKIKDFLNSIAAN